MARSKRQLIGRLRSDKGDTVWVYKGGRSYWISSGTGSDHLCHPSVRSIDAVTREAMLVFHLDVPLFEPVG